MMDATRKLRILYAATMHRGWYGLYRKQSLERLGHTLIPLEIERFHHDGNGLTRRIHFRMQVGGPVDQMNAAVLEMAREHRVDMVWFDKPLWIRIPTLHRLREMGIGTVDYMIDNPFGPRNDPGFGLYVRAIPEYDLHVQQRDVSLQEYLARGARRMVKVQTAFEPTVHFPPPAGWSDADRTRQVSFIGTPYDQRGDFLTGLWKQYGLPVIISGPPVWRRKLSREACAAIYPQAGELYDAEYRRGIWESRINLSFLTHGNQDEYAHKSFEIAACGGFLLAERSAGHLERFREDEEAVFFSDAEECAAKIKKYLHDEPARQRIAAAGQRRAAGSGYDNDTQMRKIFAVVEEILPEVVREAADAAVATSPASLIAASRIYDLAGPDAIPAFAADVCIVGAGAAGLTLAAELVRQGKRVLLLESGGRELEDAAQQLNACERVGQPLHAPHLGRFRALGGTTTYWGGQILEMPAEDFEQRDWIAGSGWPMPKTALQRYYQRALEAEGLSQVLQTDTEVWRQLDAEPPQFSGGAMPYFTRWCPETNFVRLYREALASPRICVVLHATACELIQDSEGSGDRIRGVRCRSLSGEEQIFEAEKYVLCMGMMETVNFLLQPAQNGRATPWQENGWLGRHVQSHIDYNAARIVPRQRKQLADAFANVYLGGRKYHPKLYLDGAAQRAHGVLSIAGAVTCISSVENDVRQIKAAARNLLRGNWAELNSQGAGYAFLRLPMLARLGYGYQVRHRAYWPEDSTLWLRVHCEQEPLSASSITLSRERDALGMLRARIDWQVSPLEWKTIQHFTWVVERAMEDAGLATLELQPELAREDGYRALTLDDSYHWMGGTRMAVSAGEGVVDTDLKLHGVRNAYVCGLSIFPTSGYANPVHTMLALALRLADHLTGTKANG